MSSSQTHLTRKSKAIFAVGFSVIILLSCLTVFTLYQNNSPVAYASKPSELQMNLVSDKGVNPQLSANEPCLISANVSALNQFGNESFAVSDPVNYTWTITPQNGSAILNLNSFQNTFPADEPYTFSTETGSLNFSYASASAVEVWVHLDIRDTNSSSPLFNQTAGYSMVVADPPSYPAHYLTASTGSANYIIHGDEAASWYYAVNVTTGQIVTAWSSTASSSVIQQALNALPSGRTYMAKIVIEGDISLTAYSSVQMLTYNGVPETWTYSALVPSYTEIELDGSVTAATNTIPFLSINSTNVWIHGGTINGNYQQTQLIVFLNQGNSTVENMNLEDTAYGSGWQGVLIDSRGTDASIMSSGDTVRNCHFENIGDYVIYLGHSSQISVSDNTAYNATKGIMVGWDSYLCTLSGNHLNNIYEFGVILEAQSYENTVQRNIINTTSTDDGIQLIYDAYQNLIDSNTIVNSGKNGISVKGYNLTAPSERAYIQNGKTEYNTVTNNIIDTPKSDGITLFSDDVQLCLNNSVSSNTIKNPQSYYAIREISATGLNNTVLGNSISGNNLIDTTGSHHPVIALLTEDKTTSITNNLGDSQIGYIPNPIQNSDHTIITDTANGGALNSWSSARQYTNQGLPKTVYIDGSTAYTVVVNGVTLASSITGSFSCKLEVGNTFNVTSSSMPTINVFALSN